MTGNTDARDLTLIGRRQEQELLGTLLDAAITENGHLVLVSGEAGIGKTALVAELTRAAAARNALVLTGACYDLTTTPPYGPWIEVAREYQRVLDAATPADGLPPPPTGLVDAGERPAVPTQRALFDEVGRFISSVAKVQPLVIVLEDLHWSDPASIDLLRAVARQRRGTSLLVAVTYRGDELDRDARLHQTLPLLVRESGARRIDLRPLEEQDIHALVAASYPTDEQDHQRLVKYLVRRAEGNPFYTLELLRGLEAEGLLTRLEERWAVGALEELQVPALLRQVIDIRLARLDNEVERQLNVASVLGQDVPLDLWCAVLGIDQDEIVETLEAAMAAQIAEATTDGRGIRFRHALFRDALYQSILPPRRRALHREIGEWLAASIAPDPDAVAWHFQAAGDDRAASWLIRAGERAQRAYAWMAAAERFAEAGRSLPPTASNRERGWLRYRTGRLLRHANTEQATAALREAEQLGAWTQDPILMAYARFDLGHIRVIAGDYRQGIEQMIAGDALLDALPAGHAPPGSDIAAWVADTLPAISGPPDRQPGVSPPEANPRRGTLIQWLFEPGRFREVLERGEPYVQTVQGAPGDDEQLISSAGDAWFGLGRTYAAYGEPDKAWDAMERAADCYRRIDHHLLTSSTLRLSLAEIVMPYQTTDLALRQRMADEAVQAYRKAAGAHGSERANRHAILELLIYQGEWSEAREILTELTAQPGALAAWKVRGAAALGRLAREQGEPDLAQAQVREVLPDGPGTGPGNTSFIQAIDLQILAIDLALDRSDTDLASAWLESLRRWLNWAGAVRWWPEAALAQARLQVARGELEAARATSQEALQLASAPRQPLALLACHRTLGEIETQRGNHDAASKHLSQALQLADQCAVPYEQALTRLATAELRFEAGDPAGGETALIEANEILQRLGAALALESADRLAARIAAATTAPGQPFGLSARELEVLQLVAQGLTDAEIAARLFISYRTVTTHISSIFNKLGVNSRVSATRLAVERGIV